MGEEISYGKIIRESEGKNAIRDITEYINSLNDTINDLQLKLAKFNRDDEIQKLNNEIKQLRRNSLKIMTEKETKDAERFIDKHIQSCGGNLVFAYILTGTGIGTAIEIKCGKCREKEDITDIECW